MPQAPTEQLSGTADALEARYGTQRRRGMDRRIAWASALVLVFAGIAFLLFSGWQDGSRVSYSDIGYTVVSDESVEVRFEVTAPANSALACAVEALSSSKGTVGWKVLTLDPVDTAQQAVRTSLVTTQPPVTGSVSQCWILEESSP